MITQDQITAKRKEYIAANSGMTSEERLAAHHAYYIWLAAGIGFTVERIFTFIKPSCILASTDVHMCDIPLREWDNLDGLVRMHTRGLSWSLSDSVCVAKSLAREYKNKTEAGQ